MKERIGKLGTNGVESKLITGTLRLNATEITGTFHSICRRYLVKYGSLISLPKGFGIADSDDTYALFCLCWLRKSILKGILKDMRSSLEPDHARNVISSQKSNGISADQFYSNLNTNSKFRQRGENSVISFEMAQVYRYPRCGLKWQQTIWRQTPSNESPCTFIVPPADDRTSMTSFCGHASFSVAIHT